MPVYVDTIVRYGKSASWPHEEACHMVADTLEELHEVAALIGLKRVWFQGPPGHRIPHYDLTPNKRRQAIIAGATESSKDFDGFKDCIRWWSMVAKKRNLDARKEQNDD